MKFRPISAYVLFIILLFNIYVSADDIFEAVKRGDIETVKSILSNDPSKVNAVDNFKYTPLDWACFRTKWHVAEMLIHNGARVDTIGWDGGSPLHRAAHHDRADIVELMIEKGTDIHLKNQWGRTPLHVAARRGCKEVAALLLSKGADPDAVTNEGWTPLHVAFKSDHADLQDLLTKGGASETARDKDGKIPKDYDFKRPAVIEIDPDKYNDYTGKYSLGGEFYVTVWLENDHLYIMEFAPDEIYPIAEDTFFCKQEPWKVTFVRDNAGEVDTITLDFLRRQVQGKKLR